MKGVCAVRHWGAQRGRLATWAEGPGFLKEADLVLLLVIL